MCFFSSVCLIFIFIIIFPLYLFSFPFFSIGEDPNGQTDQTLTGEISRVGSKLGGQTSSSTVSISNGGSLGERREDYSSIDQSHVASVIQRLGPSSAKGSSLRHAAASFYSYQQDRSRSPSPARGNGSHYHDTVAVAAASQHHRSAAPSPPHSHSHSLHHHHHQQQQPHLSSAAANGNYATALAHQRLYQSSSPSKMIMMDGESSPYSQQLQQHLHGVGHGSLTSTAAATSSSSSSSSSSTSSNSNHHHSSSIYRVDDLASRSHRLEEALLRASRKSPPMPPSTSSSQQSQNAGANHSGRTSADELMELKKRSG